MTEKNDGGPAFPVTVTDKSGQIAPTEIGMSLRDYFAAKALQGLLSYSHAADRFRGELKYAAIEAYQIADAMLKVREE